MKILLTGTIVLLLLVACSPVSNKLVPQVLDTQSQAVGSSKPEVQQTSSTNSYNGPVPILMYHSIGNDRTNQLVIQPERFREEMNYLNKAGYTSIHFSDLIDWKQGRALPSKPIIITLDDGYEDNYVEGYPILKQSKMKATIFIITNMVGQPNRLTWQQINEMQGTGVVEFGAHTRNHIDLGKSPVQVQREEILGSKKVLEEKLGAHILSFAYPSGKYSRETVKEVEQSGFAFAVTTKPGWAEPKQGFYTLHRVRINGSLSLSAFKKMFP